MKRVDILIILCLGVFLTTLLYFSRADGVVLHMWNEMPVSLVLISIVPTGVVVIVYIYIRIMLDMEEGN